MPDLSLKERNPNKTPEYYYCSDAEGNYTLIAEDTSDATNCIRSLRRKVQGGDAEFRMYADHIEIWYNDLKVAGADLVAEYFTTSWQAVTFDFSTATITKIGDGAFRFLVRQGNNIFGLEWSWAYGIQTKQTFYLDVPNRLVRIKWRVEVLENALAINRTDGRGLKYSVDDYTGEVTHTSPDHPDEGWSYHFWLFEPDGHTCEAVDTRTSLERYEQGAGLVVDPYLELEESGSDIIVTVEGDVLTFGDTYDATVAEDASPIRVIITETNIVSVIYPEVMFRYGGGTSAMTGNDHSAENISGTGATRFDFFPLSDYVNTNKAAMKTQYQNPSDLVYTTGAAVTSGVAGHTHVANGFWTDGAYHVDTAGTDGDEALLELGQIEHKPNIVIHDWPLTTEGGTNEIDIGDVDNYGAYFTGNSGTTQLADGMYHKDMLCHLDFEGATDEIRRTCKISGVIGTYGSVGGDIVEGAALVGTYGFDMEGTGGTDEHGINYINTNGNILDVQQGCISFWIYFDAWVASDYFGMGYEPDTNPADNRMELFMSTTSAGVAYYESGGTTEVINFDDADLVAAQWNHVQFKWNQSNAVIELVINGVSIGTDTIGAAWTGGTSGTLHWGQQFDGTSQKDALYDQVFITNNPNTPQIPCAGGVPLDVPILRND